MKKQFSKLSKTEREAMELAYHQMRPEDFDEQMGQAKRHTPSAIRLPDSLVTALQTAAATAGETSYQPMVTRWIEERLQLETSLR